MWWQRCQPHLGRALVIGLLFGILVGLGTATQRVTWDILFLWSKYQVAQGLNDLGLSSTTVTWPGERGEVRMPAKEVLRIPGLDAWANAIAGEIGHAVTPALLSGLLAFAVILLRQGFKTPQPVSPHQPHGTASVPRTQANTQPTPAPEPAASLPQAARPLAADTPYLASQATNPPPPKRTPPENQAPAPREPGSASAIPPAPPWTPGTPASRPNPELLAEGSKLNRSYEGYWQLQGLPFENVPDPKFYFPAPMHEEALHRLLYGIETNKGALMLTGEIGCGKTLLSRELILHLSGQRYDVALLPNPAFGVIEFLMEILYQLGIEPTQTKVRLLHLLNERLLDNNRRGKQTVLVVDEAQSISDNQVFEELRLLLNFQLNNRFLLTLVLMGQPELTERVMAIKQFAQRLSIKSHLGAFSAEETVQYIQFRLKAARCTRELFTKDALDILFKQSGGIPRNINTLCDLCLLIGFMDRAASIDRTIVERAVAEWGQLAFLF